MVDVNKRRVLIKKRVEDWSGAKVTVSYVYRNGSDYSLEIDGEIIWASPTGEVLNYDVALDFVQNFGFFQVEQNTTTEFDNQSSFNFSHRISVIEANTLFPIGQTGARNSGRHLASLEAFGCLPNLKLAINNRLMGVVKLSDGNLEFLEIDEESLTIRTWIEAHISVSGRKDGKQYQVRSYLLTNKYSAASTRRALYAYARYEYSSGPLRVVGFLKLNSASQLHNRSNILDWLEGLPLWLSDELSTELFSSEFLIKNFARYLEGDDIHSYLTNSHFEIQQGELVMDRQSRLYRELDFLTTVLPDEMITLETAAVEGTLIQNHKVLAAYLQLDQKPISEFDEQISEITAKTYTWPVPVDRVVHKLEPKTWQGHPIWLIRTANDVKQSLPANSVSISTELGLLGNTILNLRLSAEPTDFQLSTWVQAMLFGATNCQVETVVALGNDLSKAIRRIDSEIDWPFCEKC